jgi:hypothetical protein
MATQKTKAGAGKTTAKTGTTRKAASKTARHEVVRKEIVEAEKLIETNYIALAKLLYEAYHKEFYLEWGYEDFREFCDAELSTAYRKSMYLVDIWGKIKELSLPAAKVAKLGWTKMKDIAAVINEKNAKEWLAKAEKMTTRELTDAVKVVRKADPDSKDSVPMVTTMTFKMGEAEANVITQAVEEAKKLVDSSNPTLALEMICQDWMAEKGSLPERTSLEDHIAYLEKVYSVKLTYKAAKPTKKQTAAKKKAAAKKVEAEAEKKAADRKANGDADIDDIIDGDTDDGSEADIDDLLGID